MERYLRYLLVGMICILPMVSCASQSLTLSLEEPTLSRNVEAPKTPDTPEKSAVDQPKPKPKENTVAVGRVGMVQAASAAIYRSRSTKGGKYASIGAETPLAIVDEKDGWYGVLMANGATGWIPCKDVKLTGYELVSKKPTWDRGNTTSRGSQAPRTGSWTDELIRAAKQYQGVRYIYGGTDPNSGMDCSAFVRMIFSQFSIPLPRTAREQSEVGVTVPFDQLQPGDRLYFACKNAYVDHCGIYAGNGYFVHCSSSKKGVGFDSLATDFYGRSLVVAKRS